MDVTNIDAKLKQMQQIKQICGQGREINNLEIRSIIVSIASNLQKLFRNQYERQKEQCQKITKSGGKEFAEQSWVEKQLNNITETIIKKNYWFDQKIEKIGNSMELQLQKLKQQSIEELKQHRDSQERIITQRIQQISQRVEQSAKIIEAKLTKQINVQIVDLSKKIQKIKEDLQKQKKPAGIVQEQAKAIQPPIDAKEWIDTQFFQYKNLSFSGNEIKISSWTDIFGKRQIQGKCQFKLKITKMQKKTTVIGIIDSNLKAKIKACNQPNQIYYHSQGKLWDGVSAKNIQGLSKGFAEGETVKVAIDTANGKIEWSVNDQIRCYLITPKLIDSPIKWVPFIFLNCKGDSISLIN